MHLSQRLESLQSLLPVAAIAVLATACGDVVCILPPRPAIQAEIRDSVTGAAAAFQASVVVTNETVYDSSFFGGAPGFPFDTAGFTTVTSASNGRRGTYTVRVRRPRYRVWERTNKGLFTVLTS